MSHVAPSGYVRMAVKWLANAAALAAADACGELRGRPGFPAPRASGNHPLYARAAGAAYVVEPTSLRGQRQMFVPGRDIPRRVVGVVPIAAAQCVDRAGAPQQSQSAIGARNACARPKRPSTPRRENSFRSFKPTSIRRASAPPRRSLRSRLTARQIFNLVHRAAAGVVHVRRLGAQSAHGRIAAGAGRHPALSGRGGLSHADRQSRGRGDHRSLAARPDRRHRTDHRDQYQDARNHPAPVQCRLRQSQRRGAAGGGAGAGQERHCRRCARRWRSSAT